MLLLRAMAQHFSKHPLHYTLPAHQQRSAHGSCLREPWATKPACPCPIPAHPAQTQPLLLLLFHSSQEPHSSQR